MKDSSIVRNSFVKRGVNLFPWVALALFALSSFSGACPFEEHEPEAIEDFTSCQFMCEDSPDLTSLKGKLVEVLNLWKSNVRDLGPLKGLPIRDLTIFGCPVSDLSALSGMPLEKAWIGATDVKDFSPLKGAPLKDLSLFVSEVTDISFVAGMPLESLDLSVCASGRVTDLRPLKGMNLRTLQFGANTVTEGIEVIRAMKSLEAINGESPEDFWKKYDADAPVRKRLAEAGVEFRSLYVSDKGTWSMEFSGDDIEDLSLLRGMPIVSIELFEAGIADFSPLRALKLTSLRLTESTKPDLSTLQGLPLNRLIIDSPQVDDVSSLKELPLKSLYLRCEKLRELSGLEDIKLETLSLLGSSIEDLTPLKDASIENLKIDLRQKPKGLEVLKEMKSLIRINNDEVEYFWSSYDSGEFDSLCVPTWMLGWD